MGKRRAPPKARTPAIKATPPAQVRAVSQAQAERRKPKAAKLHGTGELEIEQTATDAPVVREVQAKAPASKALAAKQDAGAAAKHAAPAAPPAASGKAAGATAAGQHAGRELEIEQTATDAPVVREVGSSHAQGEKKASAGAGKAKDKGKGGPATKAAKRRPAKERRGGGAASAAKRDGKPKAAGKQPRAKPPKGKAPKAKDKQAREKPRGKKPKPDKAGPKAKPPQKKAKPPKGKRPKAKGKRPLNKGPKAQKKVKRAAPPKGKKPAVKGKQKKGKGGKHGTRKTKAPKGKKPKKPKSLRKKKPGKPPAARKAKLKKAKAPKGKKPRKPKKLKKKKPVKGKGKKARQPKKPKSLKKRKPRKRKPPKKPQHLAKAKGKEKKHKPHAASEPGARAAQAPGAGAAEPGAGVAQDEPAKPGEPAPSAREAQPPGPGQQGARHARHEKKAKPPKGKAPAAKGKQKKRKPSKTRRPKVKGKQKPKRPRKPPRRAPGARAGVRATGPKPARTPGAAEGGSGKGDFETGFHTPKYRIKTGQVAKELPPAFSSRVVEIVVDQAIDMADTVTFVARNDDFAVSDDEDFKPGAKIEVELGYEEHGARLTKVIEGDITALKADFPRRGPMFVRVIGMTGYHRLMRGRFVRSWEKKTYADIAKAIADECKLKCVTDATPGTHEYVFQRNQTNLEFLLEIAELVGFEVFVAEGKLNFRKPTADKAKVRTLKKGEVLLAFNPRSSASYAPTGVKVTSFDDMAVAQVAGLAQTQDAGSKMGGQSSAPEVSAKLGGAVQVVAEQVFRKASEAKSLAVSLMQSATLDFVRAEASVQGSADLRPGLVVDIQGVGPIFSGPYYITRAVHDYLPSGFTTKLMLKKTSIELPPPPEKPPKEPPQPQPGGETPEQKPPAVVPGPAGPTDIFGKKPKLKNLKLAVGEVPPEWWPGQGTDLDEGPELTNLKLSYGEPPAPPPPPPPPPPPIPELKLTPERTRIDAGAKVSLKVEFQHLDKVDFKVEPAGIFTVSKPSVAEPEVLEIEGKKDGKAVLTASGSGKINKFEKVEIEVVGPVVKVDDMGYKAPSLKLTAGKSSLALGERISLKVEFANLDSVTLKAEPAGAIGLSQTSLKEPMEIVLEAKKDGRATITASAGKFSESVDIEVVGPTVSIKDIGYRRG